jgi:hypothetical protein
MPHPADDPIAALAITRGLPGQLQKAKATGDLATIAALEAVLVRARKVLRATAPPPPRPPLLAPPPEEGWAEIVADNRPRWRR